MTSKERASAVMGYYTDQWVSMEAACLIVKKTQARALDGVGNASLVGQYSCTMTVPWRCL